MYIHRSGYPCSGWRDSWEFPTRLNRPIESCLPLPPRMWCACGASGGWGQSSVPCHHHPPHWCGFCRGTSHELQWTQQTRLWRLSPTKCDLPKNNKSFTCIFKKLHHNHLNRCKICYWYWMKVIKLNITSCNNTGNHRYIIVMILLFGVFV